MGRGPPPRRILARAAYSLALEQLAARPEDVIFVDDRPVNVAAARAAGMRAEVFRGPAQWETFT